jgi:hypothetical protein
VFMPLCIQANEALKLAQRHRDYRGPQSHAEDRAYAEHSILINHPTVVTPWGARLCRRSETVLETRRLSRRPPQQEERGTSWATEVRGAYRASDGDKPSLRWEVMVVASDSNRCTNMRVCNKSAKGLIHGLLIVMSASAFGGDGLSVIITNNTTENLNVTVYDLNANPVGRVLSDQTINGFASLTVTIVADDSGEGHLSWTATSGGRDMRKCGRRDKPNLNDGDTVNVYADSDCGT